jgi:hypothetical protein
MLSNADLTGTFKAAANVSSANRQVIHFKSGSQDYLIDHVRVVTSGLTSIRGLQHFHLNGCGTPSSSTCIAMDRASSTVTNIQPGAKITSRAIGIGGDVIIRTESGLETDGSYPGGEGRTFRWAVCPTSDGSSCSNATAAEWAIIHKPSTGGSEGLPPIVQATAGAFRIIEVQDTEAKVAVFTVGSEKSATLAFATSHSGTGQYVVSGVDDGLWLVKRNGVPVGPPIRVGPDSRVFTFSSASGEFVVVPNP